MSKNKIMKEEIAKIDEKLSDLTEAWMDAKVDNKPKWMAKINKQLDERLKFMPKKKLKN